MVLSKRAKVRLINSAMITQKRITRAQNILRERKSFVRRRVNLSLATEK